MYIHLLLGHLAYCESNKSKWSTGVAQWQSTAYSFEKHPEHGSD